MQVIATGTRPAGAPGVPARAYRGPAAMPLPASQRPPGPAGPFNDRQFTQPVAPATVTMSESDPASGGRYAMRYGLAAAPCRRGRLKRPPTKTPNFKLKH